MNAFPEDYVVHNLPLILLSGLQEEQDDRSSGEKARTLLSEGGFRIKTDLPVVKGDTAEALLETLLQNDSTSKPWHSRGSTQSDQNGVFRVRSVGRTYTLPPRKAPPPAHSPRLRPATDSTSPPPQLVLHSTISPLTPSSPLYPDGIMTPLWITKHQSRLPAIFISFFTLVSDPNISTLQDNKLKSEISHIRSTLSATNYKTRLVVVLLGDDAIFSADVEERLNNLRRATNIDAKSLFYLPARSSQTEISEFAEDMLQGLYASCLEYYRDLSKHARRKRSRNVVPQPTVPPSSGTSQTLPLPGWNLRYEFKLGVFAEFRQEIDAALRNYEAAYEGLFGAEMFESIPSWSPRFNEARMFSDIVAIRIIRCVLWLGQTTNAVRWWNNHRSRIQDLIDRRGTGTKTYGWAAWQSMWSKTMADLITRAQILPTSGHDVSELQSATLFISTEKTLPSGQKYRPWESLHHEGYWLSLAQQHTATRRTRALEMPEEDRNSPGRSPASAIASKSHLYDKYLVPEPHKEYPVDDEPGFNYSQEIASTLENAIQQFSSHGQVRMVDILSLKRAGELAKAALWVEAISILRSVWDNQVWKQSGWWLISSQVGGELMEYAIRVNDHELISKLEWELSHPVFDRTLDQVPRAKETSTTAFEESDRSHVALDTEHALAQILPDFVFAASEGHVGEAMDAQLSVQNIARAGTVQMRLSQVKVVFEGSLKPVFLVDDRDEPGEAVLDSAIIAEVKLEDLQVTSTKRRRSSFGAAAAVGADVDLLLKPGQTKIFQVQVVPREAGEVSVASITMMLGDEKHEMTVTTADLHTSAGQWWEVQRGKPVPRPCGRQRDATSAKVLPKPPKVDIEVSGMRKAFYTNEPLVLTVDSHNHEDNTITGSMEVRLLSPGKNGATLRWQDAPDRDPSITSDGPTYVQKLPSKSLEEVQVGKCISHSITIGNTEDAIDHELEIVIDYTLLSSPGTKLTKTLAVDIPVVRPFEANFTFHPRLHDETWPNFFAMETESRGSETATGIKQQYLVTATICSFAVEEVKIHATRLVAGKIVGDAVCTTSEGTVRAVGDAQDAPTSLPLLMRPEENRKFGFDMKLQKLVLGDRQPVTVDLSLEIRWTRTGANHVNTSVLPVSRFLAPISEPRVLLQMQKEKDVDDLYRLEYTIENPSLHFLTFNFTMESSDDFAFSGSKSKSLSLVPVSRHSVVYQIMPTKSKAWIRVHLEVVDAYFGQTLRVQPASDGIRADKQGNVLLWIE